MILPIPPVSSNVKATGDGVVSFGKDRNGQRTLLITPDDGGPARELLVSKRDVVTVDAGDHVVKGQALTPESSDLRGAVGNARITSALPRVDLPFDRLAPKPELPSRLSLSPPPALVNAQVLEKQRAEAKVDQARQDGTRAQTSDAAKKAEEAKKKGLCKLVECVGALLDEALLLQLGRAPV